ncbi:hypothetical protein [Candidatus Epulonipiscium viviparus]|uniref:hypothetical protein n=1 Tax=Candidatus Epulonipiscium viviparus TaxID=420336 RepID=UPI00016C08C4|nr:hypothetical protein [Candidatus Epulopiscium viviparus]
MKCPKCNSITGFCEEVDLRLGEVIGYHCTVCGYNTEHDTEQVQIRINTEVSKK